MEVPDRGPNMKKKRLIWLGSILVVGSLGFATLSDWREETAPRSPGLGADLSLSYSASQESPPPGRIDSSRPFPWVSRRVGSRPVASGSPVTVNRKKPRRVSGIPLAKILNPGALEPRSVTPAVAALPEGVARLGEPVTRANLSSPRPERRSSPGVPVADPDLAELEQGYQAAQARLFGGGGGGGGSFGAGNGSEGTDSPDGSDNPFDDALDDSGSDDATDTGDSDTSDPGNDGDAGDGGDSDGSSGDTGGDGGSGDSGDGSGGDTGGDTGGSGGGPIEPPFYDFLLTGALGRSEGKSLHRAWRASSTFFVLEDSSEIVFQPGFTPFSIFQDQQLYFGDSDGDGDLDVTVVSLVPQVGSTVETFHQTENGFVLFASVLTYLKSVRCLEYFDFSGGSANELALTFDGEPNLYTYASIDGTWVYEGEIAFSFTPGVLIRSSEGSGAADSLLYVIAEDFESVANLLDIRPDLVRSIPNIPLPRKEFLNVSWEEGISTEEENVLAIEMAEKIVLIDWSPARWKWNMTLSGSDFQRTIVGHYNDNQVRQTLWIP